MPDQDTAFRKFDREFAVSSAPVVAKEIPQSLRISALPRYFGTQLMLRVERTIYSTLKQLATEYHGGYWHFYDLSNGGFYMAPDGAPLRVRVSGNGFDDILSADAVGIVACLFAYSRLSIDYRSKAFAEHYQKLRAFSLGHPERSKVLGAID